MMTISWVRRERERRIKRRKREGKNPRVERRRKSEEGDVPLQPTQIMNQKIRFSETREENLSLIVTQRQGILQMLA